jgi:hypothetical protein
MNSTEKAERAYNKAFSKIITLQRDVDNLRDDIVRKRVGVVGLDTLKLCLASTKAELSTWRYILELIEKYGYEQ